MHLTAQIFGTVAILSSLIIYQQNTKRCILLCKMVQDVSWFCHYVILNCYSAAATSLLCIVRAAVFYRKEKNEKNSKILLIIFIILYLLSAVLTWKSVYSIFPALSSSLSTVAFWVKNPRNTKIIAVFASLCTLVYNITVSRSISVYIGITLSIAPALYSLFIYPKISAKINSRK